jgi:hypothetical protein
MSIETYSGDPDEFFDFILGSMQEKQHAAHTPIVSLAGKPYCPSSGTEGSEFEDAWCGTCNRYRIVDVANDIVDCQKGHLIAAYATADVNDPGFPKAWVYDAEGRPSCSDWQQTNGPDEKPGRLCAGAPSPDAEYAAYLRAMNGDA